MSRFLLAEAGSTSNIIIYVVLIVALLFILIMPFFTQRKKNKQYTEMLNSIRVGDLVKTVGGVIGKVTKIIDKGEIKTVILETGSKSEKSVLEFDITHIYCVLKSSKAPEEEEIVDVVAPKQDETAGVADSAEQKVDEKQEEPAETKAEKVAETAAEPAETKPAKKTAKKPAAKKTTTNKK